MRILYNNQRFKNSATKDLLLGMGVEQPFFVQRWWNYSSVPHLHKTLHRGEKQETAKNEIRANIKEGEKTDLNSENLNFYSPQEIQNKTKRKFLKLKCGANGGSGEEVSAVESRDYICRQQHSTVTTVGTVRAARSADKQFYFELSTADAIFWGIVTIFETRRIFNKCQNDLQTH